MPMDSAEWDRRYDDRELVWTSEANRFLIQEVDGLAAGWALDRPVAKAATRSGWPTRLEGDRR